MGTMTGRLGLTLRRHTVDEGDRHSHRNTRRKEVSSAPEVKMGEQGTSITSGD